MRILKKSLLLIFLAISSVSAIAQDYIENKNSAKFSYQDLQNYIAKEKASRANGEMEYIPIQLHLVENNIGNRGNLFEIYESLKGTNALFKAINLNFYICSEINIIKSKEFYDLDSDDENSRLVSTDFNRNAINVYFVGNINFIDACGYASLGPMSQPGYIVMQNSCASVRVMAHELGHYFSLYHTHDPIGGPEFVNGTNCKTAGDLLCDTPADPNIFNKVDINCNYTGDDRDPNGMPYSPPVHNVMAYTTSKCTREFTAEQYSKMQMYHDQYGRNFLFCSPKPDFSVKLLNSSFLIKGTTQQIDLTIENFSPEAYSGNLSLKLFLIDGAEQATEIYNDIVNENWSGYDSLPFSFSAMIPSSLKDGAYTLLAKVNDNNIPEESVVKNNSDRVKIGVYGQNAKLPDLAVSITGEETYEVGYDYVMNIHISNIGTATMEHAGIDIFISEDPFLTSDDLRIGPYGYGSMEPGQSYDSEFAITLPQNTLKPYFVLAYVDRYNDELEYLESNNFAVHKVNGISPAANRKTADLQIVNYRYLNGPKSTLNVLSQLQFRLDFKNLGPEKVRSTFLGLFLSKDNSKSPDDLLLDEKNSGLGLYTDEGDDFLTALIPKSVALGDYYFIIQLNSRGYTKESDTTNNFVILPIKITAGTVPTMEIHNLKVNSYHWKSNDTWKINATILNNGFGNISSWNNSVHLSKDRATYEFPFSEGGNIKMNYNINVPLNANESYEYSTSGSIPISYEGYYYLASCVTWDFPRKSHCEVLDNPVFIGDEVPEVASIEKILENKIEIYPNPTKDFINIKTEIQVTSISIYSGDGRLIMKTLNRKQIDVSNLKSGLYILVIQSESGVLSKKIVLD